MCFGKLETCHYCGKLVDMRTSADIEFMWACPGCGCPLALGVEAKLFSRNQDVDVTDPRSRRATAEPAA